MDISSVVKRLWRLFGYDEVYLIGGLTVKRLVPLRGLFP